MDMEKLVSLCKRRGFIFPSSEIYGGINGFWDYGPLGVELKRNIKDAWWRDNIHLRDDMVGLDSSIIMHPKVWEASGHLSGFNDPMVDCKACKGRFRADQLLCYRIVVGAFSSASGRPDVFYFTGLGGAEEIVETNKKRIEKLRAANANADPSNYAEQVGTFDRVREEERAIVPCPTCEQKGFLTAPRNFNLMFPTKIGAVDDDSSTAYLRPETAQGIFANFRNVIDTGRVKLPFGIGQIGKSFRNEINPRNFIFRSREFEQMEIEFFCHPEGSDEWYAYWRKTRYQWYIDHGLKSAKLTLRDHDPDELAFYSKATADIEYEFPFGVSELEGIAHRSDYDLKQHMKFSGKDLSYLDEERWERDKAGLGLTAFKDYLKRNEGKENPGYPYQFVPHVIEPSAGADRATLAFLCEAYTEDEVGGESRTVLKFHPRLAPIKAAVFPLVKRDGMPEKAEAIYRDLKKHFNVFFDEKGAIGRRYRRQDEIGTPFGITVDSQTLADGTVTFRDRDSCRQWRVASAGVVEAVRDLLEGKAAPAPAEG
ncbi:MAG TPA: glycine--tRNA ligase [Isosphaeraceae bacterium]|jgi:glycyl-tRNA synthetase|nr:glycine--tRNA ligase [Isosphaeraceae bacterium]